MTPHVTTLLPESDIRLWRLVRKAVEDLPDIDLGLDQFDRKRLISCHMLARAVSSVFGLEFRDGYFVTPGFDHSWVVTPENNIIDVYPIGILGGPMLVDEFVNRGAELYGTLPPERHAQRYDAMFGSEWFGKAVEKVTEEILKVRPLG